MTQDTSINYIELNAFLRISGVPGTGGQVKQIIRAGSVTVNVEVETRNKRKLHAGDIVECLGKRHEVKAEMIR